MPFSRSLLLGRCLVEGREAKPMSELIYRCWKVSWKTSSAVLSLPQNMPRERPLVPGTPSVPWNTQSLTYMDLGDSFSQFNRAITQQCPVTPPENYTKHTIMPGNRSSHPTHSAITTKNISLMAEQVWLLTCTTEQSWFLTLNIHLILILTRRHLWSQQRP